MEGKRQEDGCTKLCCVIDGRKRGAKSKAVELGGRPALFPILIGRGGFQGSTSVTNQHQRHFFFGLSASNGGYVKQLALKVRVDFCPIEDAKEGKACPAQGLDWIPSCKNATESSERLNGATP